MKTLMPLIVTGVLIAGCSQSPPQGADATTAVADSAGASDQSAAMANAPNGISGAAPEHIDDGSMAVMSGEAIPAASAAPDGATVERRITLLNAVCPGNIEVHADDGGAVFINGNEAELNILNPNYYEARAATTGITVSVSTNPDGSTSVSYSGKDGANGFCTL